MYTMPLITSIIKQPDTSGGVFKNDCMTPWNPLRLPIDSCGTENTFSVVNNYTGGIRTKIEVHSTGENPGFLPEEVVLRLLCHLFIERLPAESIGDIWESINDAVPSL